MSRFFEGDEDEVDFAQVLAAEVSTNTRCLTVQISASGDQGDNNSDTERGDGVEVAQPLGLFAVPTITATTQAPFLRVGDQMYALAVIDKGAATQACETGGTKVYGAGSGNAAAVVYIRASGAIEVTAKTGQTVTITAGGAGTIIMQDGSQAFVRGTQYGTALVTFLNADNVYLSALAVAMTAVGTFATAVGTFATAVGVAVPAVAGAAVVLNTAAAALNTALGVLATAITTRITAGTAFSNTAVSAPTGWLSTRVFGQ